MKVERPYVLIAFGCFVVWLIFLQGTTVISQSISPGERIGIMVLLFLSVVMILKVIELIRYWDEKSGTERGLVALGVLICIVAGFHFTVENAMYHAGEQSVETKMRNWFPASADVKVLDLTFDQVNTNSDGSVWYFADGDMQYGYNHQRTEIPFSLEYEYFDGKWTFYRVMGDSTHSPDVIGAQLRGQ